MDSYRFEDALSGSTVTCGYPGLDALKVSGAQDVGSCTSLFFPGCSLINYGLPLVSAVYDLLANAGRVDGQSLLCCGKILSYEPNGRELRAAFEVQLIDHVVRAGVERIVAACPNCAKALRACLAADERTAGVEVVPLPVVLADMGYRVDAQTARDMLDAELEAWPADLSARPRLFMPHDSCPDRDTGEFADGLRALMPDTLVVEGAHNRKRSFCCGSLARAAGKFEAADKQARRHGEEADEVSASAIVTACVSCSFQLTQAQRSVPVFHYLELLFDWRIPWALADQYMKLRFLFDESLGVVEEAGGARPFVGLGAHDAARADATQGDDAKATGDAAMGGAAMDAAAAHASAHADLKEGK